MWCGDSASSMRATIRPTAAARVSGDRQTNKQADKQTDAHRRWVKVLWPGLNNRPFDYLLHLLNASRTAYRLQLVPSTRFENYIVHHNARTAAYYVGVQSSSLPRDEQRSPRADLQSGCHRKALTRVASLVGICYGCR